MEVLHHENWQSPEIRGACCCCFILFFSPRKPSCKHLAAHHWLGLYSITRQHDRQVWLASSSAETHFLNFPDGDRRINGFDVGVRQFSLHKSSDSLFSLMPLEHSQTCHNGNRALSISAASVSDGHLLRTKGGEIWTDCALSKWVPLPLRSWYGQTEG